MVLLKVACTWAMPWVMFLLPLALTILGGSIGSSRLKLTGAAGAASSVFFSLVFLAALGFSALGAASAGATGVRGRCCRNLGILRCDGRFFGHESSEAGD